MADSGPGRPADGVVGWLPDGTPCYAPPGALPADGDRVRCHLCGRWYLCVASHLRAHGWTKAQYVAAFGLELGNPLAGPATRKRRAAALTARLPVEPGLVRAQARGRAQARSGALATAARTAARGRAHPAERRVKTLAALASIDPAARAEGTRRAARVRLEYRAARVAARFGFADFTGYLDDRLGAGMSMAAISREAGLHKDWVARRLAVLAPHLSAGARPGRPLPGEARLGLVAHTAGFPDVRAYLWARHMQQHRSVAAIAAEAGTSRGALVAAMRRSDIEPVPHATKRYDAGLRDASVARSLGFASVAEYVADRRARGFTWKRLAAESGMAETTLRRHGGPGAVTRWS